MPSDPTPAPERLPLTSRLLHRMGEQLGREQDECRPLFREALKAAWVDGYDTMLNEIAHLAAALPPESQWGRPTQQTRYILTLLAQHLPAWRAVSDEVREYQREHGRRECDMQYRWRSHE